MSARDDDPDFKAWLDEARSAPFEVAIEINGFRPAKGFEKAHDRSGPCPACGGTDRFSVHLKERVFNCRKCGAKGRDALQLAMVGKDKGDFVGVAEDLAGRPKPGKAARTEPRPVDHDRVRMLDEQERDRRALAEAEDNRDREQRADWTEALFNSATRFTRSHGESYLRLRGLSAPRGIDDFLRFIPRLKLLSKEGREYGEVAYPAMIAPMRNKHMAIIGVHVTYLDPDKAIKAVIRMEDERGHAQIINPKRMYGTVGLIWLSEPKAQLVPGEGIESTLGWLQSGYGQIDDPAIAAAGSLGNLCGSSLGSRPHPKRKGVTIWSGIPDPQKPGFLQCLPPVVKEIYPLVDCDVEADGTPSLDSLAKYQTLAKRLVDAGFNGGFQTPLAFPWSRKYDWADLAKDERAASTKGAA